MLFRSATELRKLGGIEETARLRFAGETVLGVPERDVERTDEDGKTSSVHFFHFPFTPAQIQAFRQEGFEVTLDFTHPQYRHATILSEDTRATLATDFDEGALH